MVRILRDPSEVRAAKTAARDAYILAFERHTGVMPCPEWVERWWRGAP